MKGNGKRGTGQRGAASTRSQPQAGVAARTPLEPWAAGPWGRVGMGRGRSARGFPNEQRQAAAKASHALVCLCAACRHTWTAAAPLHWWEPAPCACASPRCAWWPLSAAARPSTRPTDCVKLRRNPKPCLGYTAPQSWHAVARLAAPEHTPTREAAAAPSWRLRFGRKAALPALAQPSATAREAPPGPRHICCQCADRQAAKHTRLVRWPPAAAPWRSCSPARWSSSTSSATPATTTRLRFAIRSTTQGTSRASGALLCSRTQPTRTGRSSSKRTTARSAPWPFAASADSLPPGRRARPRSP